MVLWLWLFTRLVGWLGVCVYRYGRMRADLNESVGGWVPSLVSLFSTPGFVIAPSIPLPSPFHPPLSLSLSLSPQPLKDSHQPHC